MFTCSLHDVDLCTHVHYMVRLIHRDKCAFSGGGDAQNTIGWRDRHPARALRCLARPCRPSWSMAPMRDRLENEARPLPARQTEKQPGSTGVQVLASRAGLLEGHTDKEQASGKARAGQASTGEGLRDARCSRALPMRVQMGVRGQTCVVCRPPSNSKRPTAGGCTGADGRIRP